jgi:GNAT superfamily N-acetyltransferase
MNNTKIYKGLEFTPFTEQDIEVLTPIMKKCFDNDTEIHIGKKEGGPPGYDDGDLFREWYLHKSATPFKISKDGKPIGGLNLFIKDNGVNYLGNVFIDPELQGMGLGKTVWDFVEQTFPDTVKWQTDTIWFSRRNHHYYVNKCGFKIVRIADAKDEETCGYHMEKEMKE